MRSEGNKSKEEQKDSMKIRLEEIQKDSTNVPQHTHVPADVSVQQPPSIEKIVSSICQSPHQQSQVPQSSNKESVESPQKTEKLIFKVPAPRSRTPVNLPAASSNNESKEKALLKINPQNIQGTPQIPQHLRKPPMAGAVVDPSEKNSKQQDHHFEEPKDSLDKMDVEKIKYRIPLTNIENPTDTLLIKQETTSLSMPNNSITALIAPPKIISSVTNQVITISPDVLKMSQAEFEVEKDNRLLVREQIAFNIYKIITKFPHEDQIKLLGILDFKPAVQISDKDVVHQIITNLIENSDRNGILRKKMTLPSKNPKYEAIQRIFEAKFSSMIKSKEEMIKFCMRKAFKFIYDRIANKSKLTKKEQKALKNQYFGLESNAEYALPFRDDSMEKTMNEDFLKKKFAQKNFVSDYKEFLDNYNEILQKDNQNKINILVQQILDTSPENYEQGLQNIKRYPWSLETLEQTKELAQSLLIKYAPEEKGLELSDIIFRKSSSAGGGPTESQGLSRENQQNHIEEEKQIIPPASIIDFPQFREMILDSSSKPIFKTFLEQIYKEYPRSRQMNQAKNVEQEEMENEKKDQKQEVGDQQQQFQDKKQSTAIIGDIIQQEFDNKMIKREEQSTFCPVTNRNRPQLLGFTSEREEKNQTQMDITNEESQLNRQVQRAEFKASSISHENQTKTQQDFETLFQKKTQASTILPSILSPVIMPQWLKKEELEQLNQNQNNLSNQDSLNVQSQTNMQQQEHKELQASQNEQELSSTKPTSSKNNNEPEVQQQQISLIKIEGNTIAQQKENRMDEEKEDDPKQSIEIQQLQTNIAKNEEIEQQDIIKEGYQYSPESPEAKRRQKPQSSHRNTCSTGRHTDILPSRLNLSTNTSPFGASTGGELLGVSPKIENNNNQIKREELEKGITTEIVISKAEGQQSRDNMIAIPAASAKTTATADQPSNSLTNSHHQKTKTKTKKSQESPQPPAFSLPNQSQVVSPVNLQQQLQEQQNQQSLSFIQSSQQQLNPLNVIPSNPYPQILQQFTNQDILQSPNVISPQLQQQQSLSLVFHNNGQIITSPQQQIQLPQQAQFQQLQQQQQQQQSSVISQAQQQSLFMPQQTPQLLDPVVQQQYYFQQQLQQQFQQHQQIHSQSQAQPQQSGYVSGGDILLQQQIMGGNTNSPLVYYGQPAMNQTQTGFVGQQTQLQLQQQQYQQQLLQEQQFQYQQQQQLQLQQQQQIYQQSIQQQQQQQQFQNNPQSQQQFKGIQQQFGPSLFAQQQHPQYQIPQQYSQQPLQHPSSSNLTSEIPNNVAMQSCSPSELAYLATLIKMIMPDSQLAPSIVQQSQQQQLNQQQMIYENTNINNNPSQQPVESTIPVCNNSMFFSNVGSQIINQQEQQQPVQQQQQITQKTLPIVVLSQQEQPRKN